ncbi:MAG: MarR family transcriptional regulator [Candidatus Thermoplasmatota archaeon]|nr:MarR family transcriptional regulator [Candidatus Thermoplasmatota archaeon]
MLTITQEKFKELTPSSRLILITLRSIKIADVKTLMKETGLSKRTLMGSLKHLKEESLINVKTCLTDTRRRFYCYEKGLEND